MSEASPYCSAVMPALDVESLIAARDAVHETFERIRALHKEAAARMMLFGVEIPRISASMPGGHYASLQDDFYRDRIRKEVDRHVWIRVFADTHVELLMDSATRIALQRKLHGEAPDELPEVTAENIRSTWDATLLKARDYFEAGVESVYRALSWDYKTNTPGLIGQTLIVNYHLSRWETSSASGSLHHSDTLADLERVLAALDGQAAPMHGVGLFAMRRVPFGQWTPVPYHERPLVSVKLHRKGSLHIRILNPENVRKLNAIISRRHPGQVGTGDRMKNPRRRSAI